MQVSIPEDKIKLIQQNFALVDSDKDRKINEHEFKTLLRLMGQTRSEEDLNKIIEEHFEDESEREKEKDIKENNQKDKTEKSEGTAKSILKNVDTKPSSTKMIGLRKFNLKMGEISKPLNNELANAAANQNGTKKKKPITFDQFFKLFLKIYVEPINTEQLIKSFEIFDNEKTGYITLEKLKHILAIPSEAITDNDMKLLLSSIHMKDKNNIDYVVLSKKLKSIL